MRPATSAHKNRLIDPPSAKGQQISMLTRQHQHSDRVRSKFYACVIRFTPRRHGCGYFRHQPALMQPGLLERVGSCETQCRHAGSNRQSHVECSWKSWRNRCLCRHGAGSRRTPPRLRQPGCSLGSPRDTRWVGRFRGHSFIDPLTGSRLVRRAVSGGCSIDLAPAPTIRWRRGVTASRQLRNARPILGGRRSFDFGCLVI